MESIHRIIGGIIGPNIPIPSRFSHLISERNETKMASIPSERLAISIAKQCTIEQYKNEMVIYKLPLKVHLSRELSTCSDSKASPSVKRFSLGERNPMECHTSKTILLMGETGAGKTTMINAMINYVLGVEREDNFRFKLVDEQVQINTAHSQTQGVTAYDIHYREGFRIPFSLTIVDTPGFGSTEGLENDKEITLAIEKFFHDKNGIQELDAVGFVVKSPDERLTESKKYIFNSVLSIFGKDIKDNISFLATFADNKLPLILTAIKEAKLPCRMDSNGSPCHHKFNNGAIYDYNKTDDEYAPIHWRNGMENFKLFFDELSDNMPTKSLQMTQEVLKTRRCLEIQLNHGLKGINSKLFKAEHLRKVEEIIAQNKDKFDTNDDKEIMIPVMKKEKVPVGEKTALNCTKCKVTCHYPCKRIPLTILFCPAFFGSENVTSILDKILQLKYDSTTTSWESLVSIFVITVSSLSSAKCLECPGQCSIRDHENETTRWDFIEINTLKTPRDIGKDYKDSDGNPLSAQGIRNKLNEEIDQQVTHILEATSEITRYSNVLKRIALRGDPSLTMPEYIEMMIENEQKYPTPGYEKRIHSLKNVLMKARLYATEKRNTLKKGEPNKQVDEVDDPHSIE